MGISFFYFAAKIFLHHSELIRLHYLPNILFLLFLFVSQLLVLRLGQRRAIRIARACISFILGTLILWRDTWFPSPAGTLSLLRENGLPSPEYVLNFLSRFYHPKVTVVLVIIFFISIFVRKYIKSTAAGIAILLLASFAVSSGSIARVSDENLNNELNAFYASESKKILYYKKAESESSPFDIIILNICSISWDDLKAVGLENHPLFSKFDYVFDNFNSVSSYSNPAVIRLLNANCGQMKHEELYNRVPKECSLMESLKSNGFETYFALNHDGVFGKFSKEAVDFGNLDAKIIQGNNLPHRISMFDNSPVYNNYEVLKHYWSQRVRSKSARAAVFYNSVSLHDGCHYAADDTLWKKNPDETYERLLSELLDDLLRFINLVESSGRRAVIVFVPEHGRALRGNSMQVSGLRDIPLPDITIVPVGITLTGKREYPYSFQQIRVLKPLSYFAISYILSVFIEKNPFISQGFDSTGFIDSIPETEFVSQNEENTVMRSGGKYYLYGKEKKWIQLTPGQRRTIIP